MHINANRLLPKPEMYTTPVGLLIIEKNGSIKDTSIYAELIALRASSTAVSKPNVLSIRSISLSMVFGTPIMDTFSFLFLHCLKRKQ